MSDVGFDSLLINFMMSSNDFLGSLSGELNLEVMRSLERSSIESGIKSNNFNSSVGNEKIVVEFVFQSIRGSSRDPFSVVFLGKNFEGSFIS